MPKYFFLFGAFFRFFGIPSGLSYTPFSHSFRLSGVFWILSEFHHDFSHSFSLELARYSSDLIGGFFLLPFQFGIPWCCFFRLRPGLAEFHAEVLFAPSLFCSCEISPLECKMFFYSFPLRFPLHFSISRRLRLLVFFGAFSGRLLACNSPPCLPTNPSQEKVCLFLCVVSCFPFFPFPFWRTLSHLAGISRSSRSYFFHSKLPYAVNSGICRILCPVFALTFFFETLRATAQRIVVLFFSDIL